MRTRRLLLASLFLVVALMATGCERKTVTNTEVTRVVTPFDAAYIGSDQCGTSGCHEGTYMDFRNTGHPYKLNDADSAQLPAGQYYPYTSVPNPPDVPWDSISLVIGGFRWKARYIDNDGYILTGANRQWNFQTQEFVSYDAGTAPKKPYDCGPCHMTNYQSPGNQDGQPGLVGTWAFNGVQCEECHGPGEMHAMDPRSVPMRIDHSSEACGKCHIRGSVNAIPASKGFIKHHEQWNEIYTTKHTTLQCVDCHDPHLGLHALNPDRARAIKLKCENCHFIETQTYLATTLTEHITSPLGPDCIDCHMARAAKSAVGDLATFTGDVRSHLFRITTDPTETMFNVDSTLANGYITVEYACLQCHTDEDRAWALGEVKNAHNKSVAPSRVNPDSRFLTRR